MLFKPRDLPWKDGSHEPTKWYYRKGRIAVAVSLVVLLTVVIITVLVLINLVNMLESTSP